MPDFETVLAAPEPCCSAFAFAKNIGMSKAATLAAEILAIRFMIPPSRLRIRAHTSLGWKLGPNCRYAGAQNLHGGVSDCDDFTYRRSSPPRPQWDRRQLRQTYRTRRCTSPNSLGSAWWSSSSLALYSTLRCMFRSANRVRTRCRLCS